MKKTLTAAAAAAATLLAAGCGSTHRPLANPAASPSPAGTSRAGAREAKAAASAAPNPACQAQLSAWRPAAQRFEHTLLHQARIAESDLQSVLTQEEQGVQPSLSAALTSSQTLASTARQMAHHHLPPSCVAGPRAGLTAALLEFGKQAAALSNADLALSDWNPREAQQLLKAASRDITTATTGMNRATADLNSHQG